MKRSQLHPREFLSFLFLRSLRSFAAIQDFLLLFAPLREVFSVFVSFVIFPYCEFEVLRAGC
jgi:hypothetical protein